jgi:hypothetical protein
MAALLWTRHGLPMHWLTALETAVAQAQSPASSVGGAQRPNNRPPTGTQRLPPTAPAAGSSAPASRPRQAPLTKLQIETPGGPGAMEVTRPVPIPSAKVVARVGNEVILAADLMPIVNEQFQQLAPNYPPEKHEGLSQILMYKAVHEAVQGKLIVADMKDEIPKDKFAEVEKDILKKFNEFKLAGLLKHWKATNEAELDAKLKEKGTSLKAQKIAFVDTALIGEWLRKEVKYDEYVSHEELLAYYEGHRPKYEYKAKARYEEIRVNYGGQRDQRSAWNLIHQFARQVHAGAPLAQIAKTHSDAASSAKGGVNDWTNEGSIKCDALDHALFSLPVGVLSQVIDDGKGYVVVRVLERKEAGATRFQEAQAGIKKEIREQREKEARDKKLTEFMLKNKSRAWTIYDDMQLNATKPDEKKRR